NTIVAKVATIIPGGGQQAKFPILVCGAGGCHPSIAQVDPFTNAPYPGGGGIFMARSEFALEGEDFAPSQTVTIYLDGPSGQKIGTAGVGSGGTFQAKLSIPNSPRQHTLVAVQVANGRTLEAKLAIFVQDVPR